ncbi:MAG: hypothetical protein OXI23_09230 [Gemmatimonadota bacterium]|nr:hypothetical protein [Gemmatimonadota bacterium]
MKILKSFCLALCLLSANISTAHAAFIDGVNLGGGFMWNDSVRPSFDSAGGIALHTSVHVNLPGPFIFAPFYDISFASPIMQTLGMSLNYAIGMRDFESHKLFFGPSIGLVLSTDDKNDSVSERFIGGELGYKFPIGEKLGIFVRIKFVEDQNDVVSGFSGHIGATFKLFQ